MSGWAFHVAESLYAICEHTQPMGTLAVIWVLRTQPLGTLDRYHGKRTQLFGWLPVK